MVCSGRCSGKFGIFQCLIVYYTQWDSATESNGLPQNHHRVPQTLWQPSQVMILEKQLLLPICLGRVTSRFPNNLKTIILPWEQSFTSRNWTQLPNFPEVDIPANLPQRCLAKLQKAQELHVRLSRPHLKFLMVQFEKKNEQVWLVLRGL